MIIPAWEEYQGESYPGVIGGPGNAFNYQGGAIIGSADCAWDDSIIGRFFCLTDDSEVILPGDPSTCGGYGRPPSRPVYRWYRVMELEQRPDGTKRIKILRVRWSAVAAGAPKLFDDENYTWDGHERPLQYAIAPGAWVYDISRGWAQTHQMGGVLQGEHPRTLRVVPTGDRGTRFDFEPGDEIEQPVGPDPFMPRPLRIRQFDQLERRKDHKPAYESVININALADIGIEFDSEVMTAAVMFRQPNDIAQPIMWRVNQPYGSASLAVEPDSGNLYFRGGNLDLNGRSVQRVTGVSATQTPASNLRGIDVAVEEGGDRACGELRHRRGGRAVRGVRHALVADRVRGAREDRRGLHGAVRRGRAGGGQTRLGDRALEVAPRPLGTGLSGRMPGRSLAHAGDLTERRDGLYPACSSVTVTPDCTPEAMSRARICQTPGASLSAKGMAISAAPRSARTVRV